MGLPFVLMRRRYVFGAIRALCTSSLFCPALGETFLPHPKSINADTIGYCSNRQSSLSPLASLIPYFDSEWSYAQYRIPAQASHISLSSSTSSSRSPTADITDEEKCMVGWIEAPSDRSEPGRDPHMEYQLIALTYSGGWYRLSLPQGMSNISSPSAGGTPLSSSPPKASLHSRPRTNSVSSITSRAEKGKEKERSRDQKDNRELILQEYRKYGRWDGWG
jgi:hypothetical protein